MDEHGLTWYSICSTFIHTLPQAMLYLCKSISLYFDCTCTVFSLCHEVIVYFILAKKWNKWNPLQLKTQCDLRVFVPADRQHCLQPPVDHGDTVVCECGGRQSLRVRDGDNENGTIRLSWQRFQKVEQRGQLRYCFLWNKSSVKLRYFTGYGIKNNLCNHSMSLT